MTKVNNGRITSSTAAATNTTRAKAAAVLARLDEMSVSLADEISHYEDDATFDLSIKEEIANKPRATSSTADVMKKLDMVSESKEVVVYDDDDGSCGVESNDDESTVYEEISYGLSRMNEVSQTKSLLKKDEKNAAVVEDRNKPQQQQKKLVTEKATIASRASSHMTPLLPVLVGEDKSEHLEDLRNMHSCSFDGSDASSDGGFSIEEAEEEELITEAIPVLTPLVRPPLTSKVKSVTSKKSGHSLASNKSKHEHSIDKYVHTLTMDDSVLDDASIMDLQMSKTPKIGNNRKSLVGKKGGFDGTSSSSRNEKSSLFPPHLVASDLSYSSSSAEVVSVKSNKSGVSTTSTEKTDNTRSSIVLFSRAAPPKPADKSNAESTVKSDTSRISLGLFSRAAPRTDSKSSDEKSEASLFDPPSHLSIDIESASSKRRGAKRGGASSSRVSSALSLDDETGDIIRAAIIIKNDNKRRRKRGVICGTAIVFLAMIAVLGALVYTNNVPVFMREPLSKVGVIPSSPTAEPNSDGEPKGVVDTVWYADFDHYKCVQDCASSSESVTCGGKMKDWEQGFATLEECCLENFSSFIGKDWSLVDCVKVSNPETTNKSGIYSTGMPTYTPTTDHKDAKIEEEGEEENDKEGDQKGDASITGTTPWAVNDKESIDQNDSSEYILELDENFNPIKPADSTGDRPSTKAEEVEEKVDDESQPMSGTTPWAVKHEKPSNENMSTGYVLELDENFNPINSTTVAATTTQFHQDTLISEVSEDEETTTTAAVINNDAATDTVEPTSSTSVGVSSSSNSAAFNTTESQGGSDTAVYYADWNENKCLLTGPDQKLESWETSYSTEDECCLDNFDWDVNGNCFQTTRPATDSPTTTLSPTYLPTGQPSISIQPTATVLVWIHFNKKCIKVNKTTLKNNAKSYGSQDKCHLDNNLGDYQPTVSPTFSPTVAPSFSPTVSPTEVETMHPSAPPSRTPSYSPSEGQEDLSKAGMNICTVEFCAHEMTSDYKMEYRVNVPDNVSVDECLGCSLSVKLTYDGETSWLGFAVSTDGAMVGSEAVIGVPGMTPAKYYLTGKFETGVQPMDQSKQTLLDPTIEVADGQTILTFTKLLVEDGEIPISTAELVTFLWARGTDVDITYHGSNKGSFSINLLKTGSNRIDDASAETTTEVVNEPSNRPTTKQTPKPSSSATGKPSAKPTAKASTSRPTVRSTSTKPTMKQTSGSVDRDSLMELLLQKSPNTNSTAMKLDTYSAQYLGWRWLKKNPDLSTITDERKVQRWALATFYRALHGDEWTFGEGWLQITDAGVDECTWYNIMCDSSGSVISIDLRNNYLWGEIPLEISLLGKCEYLGLSSNYLTTIQPAIFEMDNLKVLDMDDNGIELIPSNIKPSLTIEELYLSHNKIASIPDVIFDLESLKAFYIFNNWIGSSLSSKIGQLASLEALSMEMNYLTGQLPVELYQLSNLKELSLSANTLNTTIDSRIGTLENLVSLRLDNNYRLDQNGALISSGIIGTVPSSIGNLKQLKELRLDNNFIQGPLPSALGDLGSLEILRIESNDVHGAIPSEIGNAVNLQYLHLWSNYIEGPIPKDLGDLVQLKELFLDDNELTGSIPTELGNLSGVDYIALANNNIEGTIPSELGLLSSITKLELQSNYLYGEVPKELGNTPLNLLQLESNYLFGDIPVEVCNSNSIQYISGTCPAMPQAPTPAPAATRTNQTTPLAQSSISVRNGVRANNNVRTRAKTNGARDGKRASGRSSDRTQNRRNGGGTRLRNKQTSRGLAQNAPSPSPTLEYWWSCNCCSECLPME